MNEPVLPPTAGAVAPPPFAMPTPPAPAGFGLPPQRSAEDLIKERCHYNGAKIESPEQLEWAKGALATKFPMEKDLFMFLNGASEINLALLNDAAPANPVSQQTAPQQPTLPPSDAPAAPPAGEPPAGDVPQNTAALTQDEVAAWDRISGTQCKSLRGLKSRLSKTHKVEWKDYCLKFNLNKETGLEETGENKAPEPTAGSEIPNRAPPASIGIPTQRMENGALAATLPPSPQQQTIDMTPAPQAPPAPVTPPPAPPTPPQEQAPQMQQHKTATALPINSFIGEMTPNLDYVTPAKQVAPMVLRWNDESVVDAAHADEAYEWLVGAFTGIDGVNDHNKAFQLYKFFEQLYQTQSTYTLPVLPPSKRPPIAVPDNVPTFMPAPPSPAPLSAPEQNAMDLITAATAGQYGPTAQQQVAHAVQQVASQQAPQQPLAQGDTSRQDYAKLLGGVVDCVFVNILDVASLDLKGRVDANQLAGQSEIESLQAVRDPEDLKYRKDRKVAEQIFSQKITEHPKLYVLVKGYDWVLPENLLPILLRRVCSGGVVKNGAYTAFQF